MSRANEAIVVNMVLFATIESTHGEGMTMLGIRRPANSDGIAALAWARSRTD